MSKLTVRVIRPRSHRQIQQKTGPLELGYLKPQNNKQRNETMKTNNNRRRKEMALFIATISLAQSVILLGGTGALAQTLTTLCDLVPTWMGRIPRPAWCSTSGVTFTELRHWAASMETELFTA